MKSILLFLACLMLYGCNDQDKKFFKLVEEQAKERRIDKKVTASPAPTANPTYCAENTGAYFLYQYQKSGTMRIEMWVIVLQIDKCKYILDALNGGITHAADCSNPAHRIAD